MKDEKIKYRVQRKISVFQEFTLGNPKILC